MSNDLIRCQSCGKIKKPNNFAPNSLADNGKEVYCYACRKKYVNNKENLRKYLEINNLNFNEELLEKCWENAIKNINNKYGKKKEYDKNIENEKNKLAITNYLKMKGFKQYLIPLDKNKKINSNQPVSKDIDDKFEVTDELMEKWGYGFTPQEYYFFERKYNKLKDDYEEKTSMHTEALQTYIIYKVKSELETAQGNVKNAKEWADLASKAAKNAKINPEQLTKADLSEGMDTFGQLVRAVEQRVDIIPVLPKYKEKPKDKADLILYCFINYIRDLKDLPPANYQDIYNFYEERKKDYENQLLDFNELIDNEFEEELNEEESMVGENE